MSDVQVEPTVTIEGPTVTIFFERTVQPIQFQPEKLGFFLKRPLAEGETIKSITERFHADLAPLKAAIYDELKIDFEVDDSGLVRETALSFVQSQRTEAQAVAAIEAAFPPLSSVPDQSQSNNSGGVQIVGKQNGPLPAWLAPKCVELGVTRVLDNRADNGAARISQKGKSMPMFLQDNGEKTAIWAPR